MASVPLIVVLSFFTFAACDLPRKNLGGPPSEFGNHVLPQPFKSGVEQRSAILTQLLLQTDDGGFETTFLLPVDSDDRFAFTVYSDMLGSLDFKLLSPAGHRVVLTDRRVKSDFPLSDSSMLNVPGRTFMLTWPFYKPGVYKLTVSTKRGTPKETIAAATPKIAVNLFNYDSIRVFTSINSYVNSQVGQPIGLVTRVTDEANYTHALGRAPRPMRGVITAASMDLLLPNGQSIDVPMHDDGLHADGDPSDGVYGATIVAPEAGNYVATALINGRTSEGIEFVRSTQQLISVLDDPLRFTGVASAVATAEQRVTFNVGVNGPSENQYRAYAEVWGMAATGPVPVAWVGGMVNALGSGSDYVVQLELDLQWAARASASAPFTLKNVVLQDVESWLPVTQESEVAVSMNGNFELIHSTIRSLKQKPNVDTEITEEMRWGVRPARFARRTANLTAGTPLPLLMTHGYCSGANPWQPQAKYFPNSIFFLDANANRVHDDFAQRLGEFAESNGYTQWAGVGHSQGGIALTHLHNYYWSGLETPSSGRLIQSVQSPYLGCSGAGVAANMIKIFGVGCGANTDLSLDGSQLWYAGISAAAQENVYYYTTTYKLDTRLGDYCNIAVNLVLDWPNDGTAELAHAKLPGGHSMGNKEGWCHTDDMKYPQACADAARNEEINANRAVA